MSDGTTTKILHVHDLADKKPQRSVHLRNSPQTMTTGFKNGQFKYLYIS